MKRRTVFLLLTVLLAGTGIMASYARQSVPPAPETAAPLPKPRLGSLSLSTEGKYSYKVTAADLSGIDSLCLEGGNGLCSLIRFNVTIVPAKGAMSQINEVGSHFSAFTRKFFARLSPGDIIILDSIRIYNAGSKLEAQLTPISILLI